MREYNERLLKNVLEDIREEQDKEYLKEIEEAANDPRFQLKEGEAEAFAKKFAKKQKKSTKKFILKVAAVFIVLAIGFSTFVPLPVQGQKRTVAELIANFVNSDFVAIGNEDLLLTYEGEYVPGWIPEGYEVESINNSNENKMIFFINENKQSIIFSERSLDVDTNIDYENAENVKTIELFGFQGLYIEKDNTQQIAITTDKSIIHISCNDENVDLIGFAKNIEKR